MPNALNTSAASVRGTKGTAHQRTLRKFPLLDGTYTAREHPRWRGQAEVLAHVPAEVLAELAGQRAEESDCSLERRSRKRMRTLRVRSADGTGKNGQPDPSGDAVGLPRRVVLEVPPLRARREDIPLLVEHIRGEVNRCYGLEVEGIARPALVALGHAPWPGNVRELEAVIEQAMIFRGSGWVTLQEPRPAGGAVQQGRC